MKMCGWASQREKKRKNVRERLEANTKDAYVLCFTHSTKYFVYDALSKNNDDTIVQRRKKTVAIATANGEEAKSLCEFTPPNKCEISNL